MVFQKGKSGNPAGRTPGLGSSMKDALLDALNADSRRIIGVNVVKLAKSGNLEAIKFIYDRIDGKVKDQVDINQSGAIRVIVDYRDQGPIDHAEVAPGAEEDQDSG